MFEKMFHTFRLPVEASLMSNLKTETKTFSKAEIITHQGEVENYIYLIKKGAVLIGTFQEQKEAILDFWFEGDYFSSYMSFLTRKPSQVYIETLDPSLVERIDYGQMQSLYGQSATANTLGRLIAESLYVHKTQRELDLLTKTAEQRYRDLLEKDNAIIEQVPVNKIARYLGIHPESLSRIRANVIS
jgi:CRP/FNR family transcriptional regulator, anaerobic regulatory protein